MTERREALATYVCPHCNREVPENAPCQRCEDEGYEARPVPVLRDEEGLREVILCQLRDAIVAWPPCEYKVQPWIDAILAAIKERL